VRKPVKALYLKPKGGDDNLTALTNWTKSEEQMPHMINWFGDSFNIQ
jgi:hypothetical protein